MRLDYPAVCQRLNKWQLLHLLALARVTLVTPATAKIYVEAIVGPDIRVECKRIGRSWAHKRKNLITLSIVEASRGTGLRRHPVAPRQVRLASVLHECAHILNFRKGKLSDGPHGEAFCRTYARLLREVF